MQLKEIQFKNIGSFGEILYTISYSDSGEIIQLNGPSGAGKSTIMSLPELLFYGKNNKVNKPAIANRINKNGYIKGTVICGPDTFIIERGFSPTFLKIYKECAGELIDIDNIGIVDGQQYIDDNIVKLTNKQFNSFVSLNLNTFKSFLIMNRQDKMATLDKVFGFDLINSGANLIKTNIKNLNQAITKNQSIIEALNNTIANTNNEIEKIKSYNASVQSKQKDILSAEQIASLNSNIEDLKSKSTSYTENLRALQSNYESLFAKDPLFRSAYNKVLSEKVKLNQELKLVNTKIELFTHSKCPTCSADFNSEYFTSIKDDLQKEKDRILSDLEKNKTQEDTYNLNRTNFDKALAQIDSKIREIKSEIDSKNKEISKITNTLLANSKLITDNQLKDDSGLKAIISKTKKDIKSIDKLINEDSVVLGDYYTIEPIYSDGGIKSNIIQKYLPSLNYEINVALKAFNFPYLIEFDSSFDAHLYHMNEEIPITTLSTGELKRTDIALICALLKLIRLNYNNINFVCFDETLSSIDPKNSGDIIKYLNSYAQAEKLNIFIVSHVELDPNYIDTYLNVFKDGSFSKLEKIED